MCESKKCKSSSFRPNRNRIRSVTTSKWELPIPGSKSYWDDVCDDLEKRANFVSRSVSRNRSFFPEPIDESDNASSKSSFIVEPIVKISPPTPMRRADESRDVIRSLRVFRADEGNKDDSYCVKNIQNNLLRIGNNLKNASRVFDCEFGRSKIGPKMTMIKNDLEINSGNEFRSGAKEELQTAEKNKLPTRSRNEFATNASENYLKKNVANENLGHKGEKMSKISEYIGELLQRGKLPTRKIRQASTAGKAVVEDEEKYSSMKSKAQIGDGENIHWRKSCPSRNREAPTIFIEANAYSSVYAVPNVFKEDSVDGKTETTRRNRSSTMEKNVGDILRIEKLNEAVADDDFFKLAAHGSAGMKLLAESLRTNDRNEEPEKDFLSIPKLGTISSYPSFSKIVTADSLDADDDQKSKSPDPARNDLLKVPKLGTVSSYPSFNSPVSESLDADDPSAPSAAAKDSDSSEASFPRQSPITAESTPIEGRDSSRSIVGTRIENGPEDPEGKTSPGVHFAEAEKNFRRRKSLKDSVRYAYRALKFLTANKTLDFEPKSHSPSAKASSASSSSGSSGRSKVRSKVEPAIKLLTYEDVVAGRRASRSSGTTYSTVKARLRGKAWRYMGASYVFPNPKVVPRSSSTTMASLKRSTSGRSLDLEEPSLARPSDEVLDRIPNMTIFPRRKCDKCLACLHRSFEQPVTSIRQLPLATLRHGAKDTIRSVSESDSSSVSLPDFKRLTALTSESETSVTDVSKEQAHSISLANFFPRRTSEDSLSPKSDAHQTLSPKDFKTGASISKPWSLSTDRSSSDSEDPQLQMNQNNASSKYFVPCHAPLVWCQNLEPLKALRFKKPVSLQSRIASISKSDGDSDTEDNSVAELRSARSETKSITAVVQQEATHPVVAKHMSVGNDKKIERQQSVVAGLVRKVSTVNLLASLQQPAGEKQSDELQRRSNESMERVASTEVTEDRTRTEIRQGIPDIEVLEDSGTSQQSAEKSITNLKTIVGKASVLTSLTASTKVCKTRKDESEEKYVLEAEEEPNRDELSLLESVEEALTPQNDDASADGSKDQADAILSARESISAERQQRRNERFGTVKTLLTERSIDALRKRVAEDLQPMEILEALGDEVAKGDPFTWADPTDPEVAGSARTAYNLTRLLTQSKKYLDPDTFSPNLEFSSAQVPLRNSRQLRRILPSENYDLIAPVLGMPRHSEKQHEDSPRTRSTARASTELPASVYRKDSDDSDDLIVHPPSARDGIMDLADFGGMLDEPRKSPYALFMEKPRRKVVTWRPLTERDLADYDPEATLKMRATRITDNISKDFCDWFRNLGGDDGNINEDVLKDMFAIDFTVEACKTMQFLVKEMPMVPTPVALCRNSPECGELARTRKLLISDAKAERRARRTVGFGTHLSIGDRFVPPKNRVREKWLRCENDVPRDLETMAVVWEGITGLDSVKGFLEWMKDHPEIKPPKILAQAPATKDTLEQQHSSMDERPEDASREELETRRAKKLVGAASSVTRKLQQLSTENEHP